MKKILLLVCAAFAIFTLTFSNDVNAQTKPKKVINVQGKATLKSRGANPNIKVDAPTVDKPVTKSRGETCDVNFVNSTGLFIKVYVDGNYKGTVGPNDEGSVTVGSGYTTIYCISAGGTQEWSAAGTCSQAYTFNLKYTTAN